MVPLSSAFRSRSTSATAGWEPPWPDRLRVPP